MATPPVQIIDPIIVDPGALQFVSDFSKPLAVGVVIVLIVVVVLLRLFGFAGIIGNKVKLIDEGKIDSVSGGVASVSGAVAGIKDQMQNIEKRLGALGDIEKRLGTVEHEVSNRPTREELHRLELSFTRLEGKLETQSMTVQSTANGVARIEDFMYVAATRGKQGAG